MRTDCPDLDSVADVEEASGRLLQHILIGCERCRLALDGLMEPVENAYPEEEYAAAFDRAWNSAGGLRRAVAKVDALIEEQTAAQVALSLASSVSLRTPIVLSRVYHRVKDLINSDLDEARRLAEAGAKLVDQLLEDRPDDPNVWDAAVYGHLALADVERRSGHLPEAGDRLSQARRVLDKGTGSPDLEGLFRHRRGLYRSQINQLDRALDDFTAAERCYFGCGMDHEAGMVMLSRAMALANSGYVQEGIDVRMEASLLVDFARRPRAALMIGQNMAAGYSQLGQVEAALRFLASTLHRFGDQLSETDRLQMQWSAGRIQLEAGRFADAEETFREIQDAYVARSLPYEATLSSVELCLAILQDGRLDEATELARHLVGLFRSLGYPQELLASLHLLQECTTVSAALRVRHTVAELVAAAPPPLDRRRRQAPV